MGFNWAYQHLQPKTSKFLHRVSWHGWPSHSGDDFPEANLGGGSREGQKSTSTWSPFPGLFTSGALKPATNSPPNRVQNENWETWGLRSKKIHQIHHNQIYHIWIYLNIFDPLLSITAFLLKPPSTTTGTQWHPVAPSGTQWHPVDHRNAAAAALPSSPRSGLQLAALSCPGRGSRFDLELSDFPRRQDADSDAMNTLNTCIFQKMSAWKLISDFALQGLQLFCTLSWVSRGHSWPQFNSSDAQALRDDSPGLSMVATSERPVWAHQVAGVIEATSGYQWINKFGHVYSIKIWLNILLNARKP